MKRLTLCDRALFCLWKIIKCLFALGDTLGSLLALSQKMAPEARRRLRHGLHEGGGRADQLRLHWPGQQGVPRAHVCSACTRFVFYSTIPCYWFLPRNIPYYWFIPLTVPYLPCVHAPMSTFFLYGPRRFGVHVWPNQSINHEALFQLQIRGTFDACPQWQPQACVFV